MITATVMFHVGTYLQQGRLHYRTDIVAGLEHAPTAINKPFDGTNQGKLIVKVSEPPST